MFALELAFVATILSRPF